MRGTMVPAFTSVHYSKCYNVAVSRQPCYAGRVTDEPYLSLPKAARALGISRITLYTQVKRGLVRARKGDNRYKVRLRGARGGRGGNIMSGMRPRTGPTSRKGRQATPQSSERGKVSPDRKSFPLSDDHDEPDDGGNSDFARA